MVKRALSCRKVFKTCLTDLCQKLLERMKNDATRQAARDVLHQFPLPLPLAQSLPVCVCVDKIAICVFKQNKRVSETGTNREGERERERES